MTTAFLTIEEMLALDTLLVSRGIVVEDMALGRSVRSHEGQEDEALPSLLVLEQQGRVRLSEETRRREEERLAKLAAQLRTVLASIEPSTSKSVCCGWPRVMVPVLSSASQRSLRPSSK